MNLNGEHYWWWVLALAAARGMDFWTTWRLTPDLSREANPIVRWLGWRRAAWVNVLLCLGFAWLPVSAAVVATCSVLIAAQNLCQSGLVSCRLVRMGLVVSVGVAVVAARGSEVAVGIGGGIVAFGVAGVLYSSFRRGTALTRRERGEAAWGQATYRKTLKQEQL